MILYPGWRSFFSSLFCYALFQSRKFCGTFFISAIDFCLQDSFYRTDFLGVMEEKRLPEWAQKGLEKAKEMHAQEKKPAKERGDAR